MQLVNFMPEGSNGFGQHNRVRKRIPRINNAFSKGMTSNVSLTCSHDMVNFGPLTAEIGSGVWGTPANFNGFLVLAALLHDTLVVGVGQTLRR